MSKTTFLERFEKANKFFDNVYHHHKATFKGMAQFFQRYADIEKDYAEALLYQSRLSTSNIPDLYLQQPTIQQGIREICSNLEKVSQLHFNLGERLREMGDEYKEEYNTFKRKKEIFMRNKFQKSEQKHSKAKSGKDRDKLNDTEKQICRDLYEGLDEYMEDEVSRSHKLKQQLAIYFSLSKKIAERQIELTNANNLKMAQLDVYVKVKNLTGIEDMIVDQFNGYGHEKLIKKDREVNKQMALYRSSLRQSVMHRQKACRFQEQMTKMTAVLAKYREIPQQLNYPFEEDYLVGIFDKRVISNYKQYSRLFKSEALREIAFAWLSSFYRGSQDDEVQSLLTVVKVNLKVRLIQVPKTKDMQEFIVSFMQKAEASHKSTLWFLMQISQVYQGTLRFSSLQKQLKNKELSKSINFSSEHPIHWKISLVIVDSLLQSVVVASQNQSVLYEQYVDILKLMIDFAKKTLNLVPTIVIALLLRKVKRIFEVTSSEAKERIQDLLQAEFDLNDEFSQTEQLKMHICHRLIHFLTEKMTTFYKSFIDFSNLVKLSIAVEHILPKNYFTAMQHMHVCVKMAGFNFFQDCDEDHRVTQGLWTGNQRLKNMTEVLQQLQLNKINKQFLDPMAQQLSRLLGVGYPVVINKMRKSFNAPIFDIIQCSLNMLNQQQGIDKEGYALRLGIKLAMLDIQQPQAVSFYDTFFKVLQNYLTGTQKQYNNLLAHARKTQLWIVEENSQATQNCIDFCSLLYKPFEFLLISLKKLEEEHQQTQFTKKYSDFIKLKLNNALIGQIQKYVKFLVDSLNSYKTQEPVLTLKYKRMSAVLVIKSEDMAKQNMSLSQIVRRLFNLMFLKEQLDQLVCDFIDRSIYQELSHSIFHLKQLQSAARHNPQHQAMLLNIHSIASLISESEIDLVNKIGNIVVFHFMRKIFANLYYQEEKGFFASDKDYKLSEQTFVKYQAQIQELFLNISKNLASDAIDSFSKAMCSSFCKAYRYEVLDTNKFKIPIKTQNIVSYLQSDLNFFCKLAKQKFMSPECVKKYLQQPCLQIIRDIEKNTQKLMQNFSEVNVKGDNEESKYYLVLLNLKRDEKAEQFVQKYKKLVR